MSMYEHLVLLARAVILRADPPAVLLAQQIGASHTFLPGGHLDLGESLHETLRRELHEELGVKARVGRYLGAIEHRWPEAHPTHYEIDHLFLVELSDPDADLIPREEHLRFFWCPVPSLADHNLLPPSLPGLIARLLDGSRETWWASNVG